MKRVLVISYYYPPYGSVGATRVSKMTRYLADHGWTATVLTVSEDDRPDDTQIEIPQESIHRVPQLIDVTALPRSLFGQSRVKGRRFVPARRWTSTLVWQMGLLYRNIVCFPDPQVGWLIPAARKALELVEAVRPDIILSSSFPNTSHLVACYVAGRTNVPATTGPGAQCLLAHQLLDAERTAGDAIGQYVMPDALRPRKCDHCP